MIAFKKTQEPAVIKTKSAEAAAQEPGRDAPPVEAAALPETQADQQIRTDTSGKRRRTRETVESNRLL